MSQPWPLNLKLVFASWLVVLSCSLGALWAYSTRPGEAGRPPWPQDLERDETRYTLLLFCHPKCPCTRATVAELQRIALECGDRLSIRAYLVLPAGVKPGWEDGALSASLRNLRGADVRLDTSARISRRFGISTSGDVALYGPEGKLRFSGGVTTSRGHEGSSLGRTALVQLVLGRATAPAQAPVYGCPLEHQGRPQDISPATSLGACCD